MNQNLKSGLAVALVTALCSPVGVASVSRAVEVQLTDSPAEPSLSGTDSPVANRPAPESEAPLSPGVAGPLAALRPDSPASSPDVIKVGERQSGRITREETIAKVHAHSFQGRAAATLYIRNIPVLTFLGEAETTATPIASSASKLPTTLDAVSTVSPESAAGTATPVKVASRQEEAVSPATKVLQPEPVANESDPVWRASAVAAKLNQIDREGFDATQITVKWANPGPTVDFPHDASAERLRDHYVIQIGNETLVTMGQSTVLPDTTEDASRDALQATNRLRRLLGNAPPLREVAGEPQQSRLGFASRISRGLQQLGVLSGIASWYGPGFHGNRSASGEIFNQNALTAAHRSLPFGTLVRVTNLDNGQSVVVRINDRGPYSYGRVIDLSAAAARAVGIFYAGVAPVRLEVLNQSSSSRLEN